MSLIACTNACVYQEDGTCHLEQAASTGQMAVETGCIHFVGRGGSQNAEAAVTPTQPTALG